MKTHIHVVGLIDVMTGVLFTALALLLSVGLLVFAPAFYGGPLWAPEETAASVPVALAAGAQVMSYVGSGILLQAIAARTRSGFACAASHSRELAGHADRS